MIGQNLLNRRSILINSIIILIIIMAVIGSVYAYFVATSKSSSQVITTKNLSLNVESKGTALNVNNIAPTKWNDDVLINVNKYKNIVKIPFSVTSTSRTNGIWEVSIKSVVMLNPNENMVGGDISNIKYKIYEGKTLIKSGILSENESIVTGNYSQTNDVNKLYDLYIYIEETNEIQNKLQDISFDVSLIGNATQTD